MSGVVMMLKHSGSFLALTLAAVTAFAATPPAASEHYAVQGRLGRIDTAHGIVVVDDSVYRLTPLVELRAASGAPIAASALKPGLRVGLVRTRDRAARVAEIRVLDPARVYPRVP